MLNLGKKTCKGQHRWNCRKSQKKKPPIGGVIELPRTGIEPVILSLLVIRFTTEPTGR